MLAMSGDQVVLERGGERLVVTEVGATIRAFSSGGVEVCWGFDVDELCPGSRGQVLAPWPNRLEDGSYVFAGVPATAAIDDTATTSAIHGLVRWLAWRTEERSATRARLGVVLHPQPAYPYRLVLAVVYTLVPGGFSVEVIAENASDRPAPFGCGFHPYVVLGEAGVDEARLQLPAARRLCLDGRGLPVGEEAVDGTHYDYRSSRPIGDAVLDDCFTGLALDDGGRWHVEVERPSAGDAVDVWADGAFPYVMCYSGDTLSPRERRRALAVEPMTCPPNALRSGTDVVTLAPGDRFSARWGIERRLLAVPA